MYKSKTRGFLFFAMAIFACGSAAIAAPTGVISFTNSAGGNSVTATPGGAPITVKVFLNASVATTGLDFYFNQITDASSNAPTNRFKVTARNSSGGSYDDPVPVDASASVSNYFLNQASPTNHGFSLFSAPTPQGSLSNFVTQFTVTVDAVTPAGIYTLTPTFNSVVNSGGFIDATTNFEIPFTGVTSLTVIVPEPATFSMVLLGGALAVLRRPRRQI